MGKEFLDNLNIHGEGQIQFKNTAGANAGKIDQDGNNLVLTNAVGDILLGDGSSDVFIGDGTNNVDIIFEQSGAIKGDGSAVTLTLGGANTTLNLENPNLNGNIGMSNKLTFTTSSGYILFDHEPSGDTGAYDGTTSVPLLKIDKGGSEKVILERISQEGGLLLGADDSVMIAAGDVRSTLRNNLNEGAENVILASETGFHAFGFPNNMSGGWADRQEFRFYTGGTDSSLNGLWIGDGGNTQFIDLNRNLKNIGTIDSGTIEASGVVDGPFTALRLANQKTYGSGTGTNETVRFAMGISESGAGGLDQREGFVIETYTNDESDSSNINTEFKVRDGGTIGTAMKLTGSNKNVDFYSHVNLQDGKGLMWGGNDILKHNGTQTYIGDNTSGSAVTITGGNATFGGTVKAATTFIADAVDPGNPTPVENNLRVSGYGIIGKRGAVYVTNAGSSSTDSVQIGVGGVHASNTKIHVNPTNSIFSTNIKAGADSTYDIGTSATRFANGYFDTLYGDGSNLTGVSATDNSKVAKAGDTMTGNLTISKTSPAITLNNTAGGGLDPILRAVGTNFTISTTSITPLTIALDTGATTFQNDIQAQGVYVGSTNTSYDFYNNGTSYLNGAVTIDDNLTVTGDTNITGNVTSGAHTINSATDAILQLNQTGTDTGWSYINFNTSGTRNYYIGQDSEKNFEIYNDNLDKVAISVKYAANTVNFSGNIILEGTGRIQGIDTVSSGTDAANKNYVDTAISNLIDGAPANLNTLNELAEALNDDDDAIVTINSALGNRVRTDTNQQGLSNAEQQNARANINAQIAGSYQASGNYITGTGSLSAQDITDIGNLSGTNTGDQDLSGLVTKASAQTISGAKTFSTSLNVGELITSNHIYGRSVNNSFSHLYRFGGLFLTWDSDSYGTNSNHSLRSTYGDTFTDSITLNSYNHIRFNIDSNNNNSTSYFEVGDGTTATSNVIFRVDQAGDATFAGSLDVNGTASDIAFVGGSMNFKDSNDYIRITKSQSSAQLGLFRSTNAVGGMYIGGNETGFRIYTEGFSEKFHLDQSGNADFTGNVTLNSRLTFDYGGDHYIEAGTNSLAFKNSSGTSTMALGFADQSATFNGTLTIPSYIYHQSDPSSDTYFGFSGNDTFVVYTAGGKGIEIDSNRNVDFTGSVGVGVAGGSNAKLEVVSTSGEVFRADAASGAFRIVADQTGVNTQGVLAHTGNITVTGTVDGVDVATLKSDFDGLGTAANFASSAFATSAQGTKADNALPKAGGTVTGSITLNDDVGLLFGSNDDVLVKFDGADLITTIPSGSSFMIGTNGGTPHDNSGKADFVVDVNANPQISLYSGQVQVGGTDMNWNSKFLYDGATKIGSWDTNIEIFTQGSSGATAKNILIRPQAANGAVTTVATFNGDNGTTLTGNASITGNATFAGDIIITDTDGTRGVFRNNTAYDLRLGGGTDFTDGAYISLSGGTRGGGTSSAKGRVEIFSGGSNFSAQADITGDILIGAKWNGGSSNIIVLDSSTNNATFAGNITISKSVGDSVLTIEADSDNNNENDNPRIELKQDSGIIFGHFGINGDANNTFTGAGANSTYIRAAGGLDIATDGSTKALTIDNTQNATFVGDVTVGDELTITTISNATADPDKFLCANGSGKVGYRTGSQVLSDIGAQAAGSYAAASHNHAASEITSGTLSDSRLSAGVFRTRTATVGTTSDWDDFVDQGTYGVASTAGAQFTGDNRPTHTVGSITFEPDYRYGHLVVTEDDGQGIQQTYYPHSGSQKVFTRTGWSNASWGDWSMNWNTKNMGSGSGLDADFLDGQQGSHYLAYSNLTGVPSSFTPASHNHAASEITSGTLATARIPNLAASKITSGTFANARISASSVTQHVTGISSTQSQKLGYITVNGAANLDTMQTNISSNATTAGNALPKAGGTMTGNIDMDNNNLVDVGDFNIPSTLTIQAGGDITVAGTTTFQETTDHESHSSWTDNSKIRLGSSNDLEIYHDGSDSYVSDTGTGDLILKGSSNVKIESADGKKMFMGNGSQSFLYHDNNIKLQTTSIGVNITGKIDADSIHRQPHFISFMIQGNPFADTPGTNFKLLPISSSGGSAANNFSSPNTDAYIVAPYGGRIKSLIIRNVRNTPTSGPTRIRVYKNGATSSTTGYVTPTGTGVGMYARWTFSDTFSQYDRIQMAFNSSSSTTDWKDCTAVLEMQYDNYSY